MTIELNILYVRLADEPIEKADCFICDTLEEAVSFLPKVLAAGRQVKDWTIKPHVPSRLNDYGDDPFSKYVDVSVEAVQLGCPPRIRVPENGNVYKTWNLPDWMTTGVEYLKRFRLHHIDHNRTGHGVSVITELVQGNPTQVP